MAASTENRFGLQYGWALGESGWKDGMDANLLKLGRFGVHLSVKNRNLTAPPVSPTAGDTHIVAAGATGGWAGHDTHVALWDGSAWQFAVPRSGWRADVEGEDIQVRFRSGVWGAYPGSAGSGTTQSIVIACSDETTALTAGTAKVTFRMPYAFTLTGVRASLTTAQAANGSGGIFTVDINEGGASILSTKLTIDNTEKTSTTAATGVVISDSALADDAEITIDIDQVGDGTAKGLKVALIGYKP